MCPVSNSLFRPLCLNDVIITVIVTYVVTGVNDEFKDQMPPEFKIILAGDFNALLPLKIRNNFANLFLRFSVNCVGLIPMLSADT